jgi:protocatechuate 3,4-dioxygenase beta subunit
MTRHLFALTLALHLAAAASWADPCTSGSLCGQVLDSAGAPVAGADVQLTFHGDAAVRHNVRTDANGQWVARALKPGDWEIVILMPGFRLSHSRSRVRCSPYRFEPKPRPIESRIVIVPSPKENGQ